MAERVPTWLRRYPADGVIARIESPAMVRFLKKRGLPTVDLRGRYPVPGFAAFDTDARATARLAIEHFRERGFRNFAFCGFAGLDFSDRRRDAMARGLSAEGLTLDVFDSTDSSRPAGTVATESAGTRDLRELAQWLKRLAKPVGILASNDARGRQVLDACALAQVRVPDEVAVAGVDNDEVLCDLADPPLTSIQPDTLRLGYEGAAMLDRMIRQNRPAPRRVRLIAPRGLICRRSSDVLAIEDKLVAAAMLIIRRDVYRGISVEDVLDQMTISRATLERRFRRYLGRSPKSEILRLRLNRVRELLTNSDHTLAQIVAATGFSSAAHLSVAFKNEMKMTPGEFRVRHHETRDAARPAIDPTNQSRHLD